MILEAKTKTNLPNFSTDLGRLIKEEAQAELARRSLYHYLKLIWPVLEPANDFIDNWTIGYVCEHLQLVSRGEIKRLLINIPPRNLKSTMCTVSWPTWEWIERPELRHICFSYAIDLSRKHSVDRRRVIQSDIYQRYFGGSFELAGDQNVKTEFENDKRGIMLATSIGGALTGKGGDRLLFDDPHNPKQALSDVQRSEAIEFYKNTAYSRLNNPKTGAVIGVMQRVHEQDLTSYLLETDEFTHIVIPGIAERSSIYHFPISSREIHVERGQAINEKRQPLEILNRMKAVMGSYNFAAQYQQTPAPAEGGALGKYWFNYFSSLPRPLHICDSVMISCDLAFKDLKSSSYVVIQLWAKEGPNYYLVDQIRDHLNMPETVEAILTFSKKYSMYNIILIEDKANGPAVIQTLKRSLSGIVPQSVSGTKEARAAAISPLIEAGNVFIPCISGDETYNSLQMKDRDNTAFNKVIKPQWVDEFINECAMFPNARHDDQVDAMSQALSKFSNMANISPEIYKPKGADKKKRVPKPKKASPRKNIRGFEY